jgi:hypothetical protein
MPFRASRPKGITPLKPILAMLAILASAAPALACSCMRPGPNAPQPQIIVNAEVQSVTRTEHGLVARLRVISRVKGKTPRLVDVHTAGHPVACGVDFQKGMISNYALSLNQGRYTANSCMQFLMNYRERPTIRPE